MGGQDHDAVRGSLGDDFADGRDSRGGDVVRGGGGTDICGLDALDQEGDGQIDAILDSYDGCEGYVLNIMLGNPV